MEHMFTKFSEITQCNGHYAVQDHSRSPILIPIESSYTTLLVINTDLHSLNFHKFLAAAAAGAGGDLYPIPTPNTAVDRAVHMAPVLAPRPHASYLASCSFRDASRWGRGHLSPARAAIAFSINKRLLTEREFTTNVSTRSILSFSVTLE